MAFLIADFLGIDKKRIVFDISKPKGALKKSTDNSKFTSLSNFNYTPCKLGLEKTIKWYLDTQSSNPSQIRTKSSKSIRTRIKNWCVTNQFKVLKEILPIFYRLSSDR